jgi:hypothetical protein
MYYTIIIHDRYLRTREVSLESTSRRRKDYAEPEGLDNQRKSQPRVHFVSTSIPQASLSQEARERF